MALLIYSIKDIILLKKDILSKLIQGGLSNQLAYSIIDPKFSQIPEIIIEEEPLPPQLKEITPSVENEKESQKNSNLSEQLT